MIDVFVPDDVMLYIDIAVSVNNYDSYSLEGFACYGVIKPALFMITFCKRGVSQTHYVDNDGYAVFSYDYVNLIKACEIMYPLSNKFSNQNNYV